MRFRTNKIIEKNKQSKKGIGLGLVYPSAEAIEIVGMLGGFDFVQLDGEHGLFSPESIDEMCRVADGFGLNVIARVPDISTSTINSYLDRGVTGNIRHTHGQDLTGINTPRQHVTRRKEEKNLYVVDRIKRCLV